MLIVCFYLVFGLSFYKTYSINDYLVVLPFIYLFKFNVNMFLIFIDKCLIVFYLLFGAICLLAIVIGFTFFLAPIVLNFVFLFCPM